MDYQRLETPIAISPAPLQKASQPAAPTPMQREIVKLSTKAGPPGAHLTSERLQPLAPLHDSIWKRLDSEFQFTTLVHPNIDEQIRFLQEGIYSLQGNLAQARPYLYFIVEEIERAGLPPDLALLPLVESAFNPHAKSNQEALGLWQFIAATAKSYGLPSNRWYDGRRDVVASTHAAIKYLKRLHRMFDGDWLLAIAAYNTGPGNVRAAIRRATAKGMPTDFWNLGLAKETRNYVPRLIAVSRLLSDPQRYGVRLPPIRNRKYFSPVSMGRQISLVEVARLAQVSHDSLAILNSGLVADTTPPDGPHVINVPASSVKSLLAKLSAKKRERERTTALLLPVEAADKNSLLAMETKRHDAGLPTIPPLTSNTINQQKSFKPFRTYHYKSHEVKPGDNLWDLSREIGTDVSTLTEWNHATKASGPLKIGAMMNVAFMSIETEVSTDPQLMRYRVSPSETLTSISDKFNTRISLIKKWNPSLWNKNHVQAGQSLRIPKP